MTGPGELAPAAFEDWYGPVHSRVVAAVRVSIGRSDVAEEAADEALLRTYERWDRVSAMACPEAWTIRVALNVARRRLRRAAFEERLLRRQRHEAESPLEATDPDLWAAVTRLPERQRMVVALRYLADLREREVAEVLRITRSTVSTTLRDAHARLAQEMNVDVRSLDDEENDHVRPA